MEFKIIWSPEAIDDLEALIRFIAGHNPGAALQLANKIVDRAGALATQPKIGSLTRKGSNVRRVLASPFWIFYRVHLRSRSIHILRVWHTARDGSPL